MNMFGCFSMLSFSFVFPCRSNSVTSLDAHDSAIDNKVVSMILHRKGQRRQSRPLRLSYGELGAVNEGVKVVRLM